MNNQKKSAQKSWHSQKGRESEDQNAVAIVKCTTIRLCLARVGVTGISNRRTVSGKPTQKGLEPIQKGWFTDLRFVMRVSGNRKDVGKSTGHCAMKFEDPSHEETERQQRCARSKAWNLAEKHLQTQRKGQSYILHACKVESPWCFSKTVRGERERVCSWFRSEYAYGQQERP